jgi:SAM-dependent methyltransferase
MRKNGPPASPTGDAGRAPDDAYTRRLVRLQTVWWKRVLDVQAPYRWNLRSLRPGLTLEIGCGIGRNLLHLRGQGVGIDTNPHSVRVARTLGLDAFTPDEFEASAFNRPGHFDSILLSHVAEHMMRAEAVALLRGHLRWLKPRGRLIIICPQERGYRSDATHVEFMDFTALAWIAAQLGFVAERAYSFPFPRPFGRWFLYNEFVFVGCRADATTPAGPAAT